jgi:hypothetical protein
MAGHGFCLQTKNGSYKLPDKKMLDYKYQSTLRQEPDCTNSFFMLDKVDKISRSLFN